MYCFEHKKNFAIGICTNCHKALCEECFIIVEERLCCKQSNCKLNIELGLQLVDREAKVYLLGKYKNKWAIPPFSIFYILFGSICIGFDVWKYVVYKDFSNLFMTALGILFLVFGIYLGFRKNKVNV